MHRSSTVFLLLTLAAAPAASAGLQDRIEARWVGGWVLTRLETRSGCGGFFTDNEIAGRLARSGGDRPFGVGELGRVEKIDLHRRAVDLMITYDEPVLIPYRDGPFTLYREATCKVELEVALERRWVKEDRIEAIDRRLLGLVERHETRAEAVGSTLWNRRRRDPYPDDYEQTLAEYRTWKAEETNRAVQARLDQAIDRLTRLPDLLERDPAYLDGFAAGVSKQRYASLPGCPALVDHTLHLERESPPQELAEDDDVWKSGFREGQIHTFELAMLRMLPSCFVPVPPPVPGLGVPMTR